MMYINAKRPLDSTCWTGFMSAARSYSAKHENFVMSTLDTQRERGGARRARSTLLTYLGRCIGGPSGPSQTSPQGRGADGPPHPSPSLLAMPMAQT